MKAVILAGGFGTRISEESHLRPKPMIEIGGAPILWHIMKHYSTFGFNDFIICCGYRGYMIKEYFANYYLLNIHSNNAEPWRVTLADTGLSTQTGGRVKRIEKYIGSESFMLTYGDGVGNVDLNALLADHRASGNMLTLTAVQPSGRYGVLDLDNDKNRVVGFREKSKEAASWINAGFMVVEPGVFGYISGDDIPLEHGPLETLSSQGKLGVHKHRGYWQCMDTQRDKEALEILWSRGDAPWKTWSR